MKSRRDQIVGEIGVREVLLFGQNVNSYGRGLDEKVTFVDLLRRIAEQTGIARIRFTTSHPKDLTDPLMLCFAEMDSLCKHLHLPVQAGSDRILARMNRGYTAADYVEKIRGFANLSRNWTHLRCYRRLSRRN